MVIITYFSLFFRELYSSIMLLTGLSQRVNLLHECYLAFALVGIIIFLYYAFFKVSLSFKEIWVLFISSILILLYILLPRVLYGSYSANAKSFVLVALALIFPTVLVAVIVKRCDILNDLCKYCPHFILIFTIAGFITAFFPSSFTSGGYINDESGLGYQNTSYLMATTFGLTAFYTKNKDNIIETGIFAKSNWKYFFTALMPIQIISLLVSGGRGGSIVAIVFLAYYIYMGKDDAKNTMNTILFLVGSAIVLTVILTTFNFTGSGLDRIVSLFSGEGDANRTNLYTTAIDYYKQKIVFGYGIGSVPYLFSVYSHNIFTDIMVEFGTIGLFGFVALLIYIYRKLYFMVKEDPLNRFWVIMFTFGLVNTFFSGYYLLNNDLWFVICYIFASKVDTNSKIQQLFIR